MTPVWTKQLILRRAVRESYTLWSCLTLAPPLQSSAPYLQPAHTPQACPVCLHQGSGDTKTKQWPIVKETQTDPNRHLENLACL